MVICEPATKLVGRGVGNVNEATLPAHVADVAVPVVWVAKATVTTPVVLFTEVIVELVTL